MKICYVANSRFPSERAHMVQIVQMCNAFVQNGHEVTLLVTDRKTHIGEDPEKCFGTKFLFSVIRVSVPDVAGASSRIPKYFRPAAFLLQRIVFAFRVASYVKKHTYTHVYGRDEWVLWLLTHLIRIPITWESHEAKFSYIVRKLLRRTEKVVVISEGIRDYYMARGVHQNRILVAHDAVDERFFKEHCSQREAWELIGITPQKPVVMYIGGLEEWKGAKTLFEASKNQDTFETYVIGGKVSEVALLKAQYPEVHFVGFLPYKNLPQYQQAADVLVIPNTGKIALSAEYTSPLKLFTYLTSKKPIIASRIPSITNVLTENEVFFFTADDAVSLQSIILNVIQNKEDAQRRAHQAYEKSTHHTWIRRAKDIASFISS